MNEGEQSNRADCQFIGEGSSSFEAFAPRCARPEWRVELTTDPTKEIEPRADSRVSNKPLEQSTSQPHPPHELALMGELGYQCRSSTRHSLYED